MAGSAPDPAPVSGAPEANISQSDVNPVEAPSGLEAYVAQQSALRNIIMLQMKDLSDHVVVAEAASVKAVAQMAATAESGDAELEALQKLPYVPHVSGNPFPTRASTLESDMPQMYELYNDKPYDSLSK
ncbi:hypothetical protein CYMTET_24879 [Cymbomonas tetramitiformis]|uniref:Uncharacterized protein n=1 Tax=Cymbomonas tetramitiformis TaxID=36881 RepID=A0AAE0FUZ5_9CHLO|nr:hypothetical protein CYMTET_24879 [Cymbomonas tetramitiformis]